MKKKVYYYVVCLNGGFQRPFGYYKAHNKRQIKAYLNSIYESFGMICDPTEKPVDVGGIHYIDVTVTELAEKILNSEI